MTRRQIYRLTDDGEWRRVLPKVFATFGSEDDWLLRVSAANLWAGSGAASHRTAAVLWQMEGFEAGSVEMTMTRTRRSPSPWLTVFRSARFAVQRRHGIPVTTVARTLIDLGHVASPRAVERALEDSLRRRLTTVARVNDALAREGGRGRRGAATLGRILRERAGAPTESELERRLLALLRDAGLPPPRCQHLVRLPGGALARLDFAYPDAMLGIEADGYRWHSGREAWSDDRTRTNGLVGVGWRILHTTWTDVGSGAIDLIATIRTMLGQRSLL
jgi:very-short-patch-repair endonuclease